MASLKLGVKKILILTPISMLLWCVGFVLAFFTSDDWHYSDSDTILTKNLNLFDYQIDSLLLSKKIIFTNLKCITVNAFGFCTLGLLTCINLIFNGFIHGISIKRAYSLFGYQAFRRVLPHSFELLGIFISGAIGLYASCFLIKILFHSNKYELKLWIYPTIILYIISCQIIVIAGFVEGYISVYR